MIFSAGGGSPITQARAQYWRGRTAETRGDPAAAQAAYQEGAIDCCADHDGGIDRGLQPYRDAGQHHSCRAGE